MSQRPLVSIVIATFNSQLTLPKVLVSIKNQNYPKNKIEILIIDGVSQDSTLSIARKFKCKILNNPKRDQVYAKNLGYKKAKGKYLMFLDSDEVLSNKNSIRNKSNAMLLDSNLKAVTSSGYKTPPNFSSINSYINEFGDPFSYFIYRCSRDYKFFINETKTRYEREYENKNVVVFDFSKEKNIPFIELTSMGVLIDLSYVKKELPEVLTNTPAHTHLFYLLTREGKYFGISKHDPIIHYSVSTFSKYLKKITSRIKSNIYSTNMGLAGYKGREEYYSFWTNLKKILFIPYSLTLILPIYDSISLAISRKKSIYLLHLFLCLYTVFFIVYYNILKIIGVKIKLSGYGT